jgi:riboflavin synthase
MHVVFPAGDLRLEKGESINIDGICSTVEEVEGGNFRVYYMEETLRRTHLSNLPKSHTFNIERCLSLESLIGGHLVYGHVDTTGKVLVSTHGKEVLIQIVVPEKFTKYMVYKGSVTVNGVSLTIVSVTKNSFSVSLIPYTLKVTNLSELKNGDLVNVEVDMMAKYIEKLIRK